MDYALNRQDTGNFCEFFSFLFFRECLHLVNVMVTYKGRSGEVEESR